MLHYYLLSLLFTWVRYVQAVGVIIPLYHGPGDGDGCPAWEGYLKSINDYPDVPFYSIVNPNDGPGRDAQPGTGYRACIQLLRPRNTTLVLGYIDTASGQKTEAAIHAEIDLYAGWDREYRPNGIYFDSSPSSSSRISLYQNHVNYARSKNFLFNGLGAGQTPDTGYFDFADFVTTYESSYSSFGSTDIIVSSSTPASKQTAIITEAPSNGSYASVITILKDKDIRAAFITDLEDGNAVPSQWNSFVSALAGTSQLPPPTTSVAGDTTAPSGTGSPQSPPGGENSNDGPSSRSMTGAIAGGVVGGVVAVLIGVGICVMLRRAARRRKMAVSPKVSPYRDYPLTPSSTSPLAPVRGPPADYSQDNLIETRSEAHSNSPTTTGLTATMGLSGSSWNQPQTSAVASSRGGVSTKGSTSYATSPVSRDDSNRHSIGSSVPPPLYSERPSAV